MLPTEIRITTEDIEYAEKILFNKKGVFSFLPNDNENIRKQKQERQSFIKNLDTIDLQAVPGSGKTTALLAKLLILESYMPFDDGSGILVISHTNAAINEITKKIKKYCPRLFSYPSFVGTIQNFVDRFLAIPFYINKYKKKIYRIDNEIYDEKVGNFYKTTQNYNFKKWVGNNRGIDFLKKVRFDKNKELISDINNKAVDFKLKDKNKPTYKAIVDMKEKLLKWGYLTFDDAYLLANWYLDNFPRIKKFLQKRFQFVFVDEMQDMDKQQHDLLEIIFYSNKESFSKYQRIGDLNQAIHSDVSSADCWTLREDFQRLSGSYRLTPNVANVVKCFGLNYHEIEGLREDCILKAYILVFENPKNVLPKFTELIRVNNLSDEEYPFCAISWTTHKAKEDENSEKIRLQNYYPFNKNIHRPKIVYTCLKEYLKYYKKKEDSIAPIKKNILNALVKILRIENIKDENDRDYTNRKFVAFLKENDLEKYEDFKLKLFEWSFAIKKGEDIFEDIKNYIPSFFRKIFPYNLFNKQQFEDFMNSSETEGIQHGKTEAQSKENNFYKNNGVSVRIGTVHSVKGETHTATLYMESFYQKVDNYESLRLKPQINGEKVIESKKYEESTDSAKKFIKQSAKMAYVGFSRPTHLLCFAIRKKSWEHLKIGLTHCNWEVIYVEPN